MGHLFPSERGFPVHQFMQIETLRISAREVALEIGTVLGGSE